MRTVLACVVVAMVAAAATATASSLITGSQIAANTIHNHNIHKNTVSLNRLTPGVQKLIRRASAQSGTVVPVSGATGAPGVNGINGTNGKDGVNGTNGTNGAQGPKGDPAVTTVGASSAADNHFSPTNNTVLFTANGVQITDATGNDGGSVKYTGLNGLKLRDLAQLQYTAQYTQTGTDFGGGMPYLRIFVNNDNDDVIFSPNTQTPNPIAQPIQSGKTQHFDVVGGLVRFDDDGGSGGGTPDYGVNGKPWDFLISNEGDDVISGVYVSAGFSGAYSQGVTALVNSLTTEAKGQPLTQFTFGG